MIRFPPSIKRAMGPFTVRRWHSIASLANTPSPAVNQRHPKPFHTQIFVAKITGSTEIIADRRWSYEWEAGIFDPSDETFVTDDSISSMSSGTDGANYGLAYNTVEALQQDSGDYDGPGLTHANIPSGYTLQPVKEGTFVLMLGTVALDGTPAYCFSVANAIDGECA